MLNAGLLTLDLPPVEFNDLALHDRNAARHMAQQAHLLALGDPEYAREMTTATERAERRPAAA